MDIETTFAPARLAEDLGALARVDWTRLWAEPITNEVAWCLSFGWGYYSTCRWTNRMDIRLDVFSMWHIEIEVDRHKHAKCFEHGAWSVYFEDALAVSTAALAAWDEYLPAITAVLGQPVTLTSWDDPHFPDGERWSARRRHEDQSPYRLALWRFTDAVAEISIQRGGEGRSASISAYVWQP